MHDYLFQKINNYTCNTTKQTQEIYKGHVKASQISIKERTPMDFSIRHLFLSSKTGMLLDLSNCDFPREIYSVNEAKCNCRCKKKKKKGKGKGEQENLVENCGHKEN